MGNTGRYSEVAWSCYEMNFASGGAHVVLASWWGNGPPRQRWLAGVRARPAPLALRHWPDSYGRLQSRIFGNGRKPDRATPRVRRRPSGCKALWEGRNARKGLTVPSKKARAKFVPAAAVRRTVQTLFGITGLKGRVGGPSSQW